jgi:hypothetical protein
MESPSISCMTNVATKRIHIIAYICQVAAIFAVISACLINLSIGDDKAALWSSLLSGALGYLLPAPKIRKDESFLPSSTQQ